MNADTQSLWALNDSARETSTLPGDLACDVCIVGSGIAGLTTAYLLLREGKRVVVVDAKPAFATGETEHTSAHLAWYIDDTFYHLASVRGDEVAKRAAESHRHAIGLIRDIAASENIDCDFQQVDGYLFSAGTDGPKTIENEVRTLERLQLPFQRMQLSFPGGQSAECLRFPDHAQFHPIKYLAGLAAAIRKLGGVIHTSTVIEKVRAGSPATVTTTHGKTISAGAVVTATNNPFEGGTELHNKVAAYNTYVIAAEVPRGSVPYGLYWDTLDPYHYVRLQPGPKAGSIDYLIVGGEDHKTGQADDQPARWDRLKAWTKERYPAVVAVQYHWSGQVFETPDGLGLFGLAPWNSPNVFVMTGDSGMGLTHGTLGARLVADLVMGRPNDLASVYSPSRLMPGALRTLLGENLNMVAQFRDWVTGGDVSSPAEIPPGHGAIIRSGLTKHAVYRNEDGQVTTLSAICPHMGCLVRWNPGEKTWDCPCHGSRFSAVGTCIHGPSTADLAPVDRAETGK